MENLTEQIINDYARQQKPGWREAYLKDVATYTQVNTVRGTLEGVERAMRREGLPDEVIRRVLHRAAFGEAPPPGEDA